MDESFLTEVGYLARSFVHRSFGRSRCEARLSSRGDSDVVDFVHRRWKASPFDRAWGVTALVECTAPLADALEGSSVRPMDGTQGETAFLNLAIGHTSV